METTWRVPSLASSDRSTELLSRASENPEEKLTIDLNTAKYVYPNGAVPFAATLSFLEESQPGRIAIDSNRRNDHVHTPLSLNTWKRGSGAPLTNSVWRYESESEAQQLTNLFMDAITDNVYCEEGVIDTINWCLYEVLDNVFQHSSAATGYVMMQLHRNNPRCAIAVADNGIGIHKSLALGNLAQPGLIHDPGGLINHALEKGVTSKGGANQGNGLYGLRRAVEINGGQLDVRSGWGHWSLRNGEISWRTDRHQPIPDPENHQATLVDWQLDCSTRVRIDEALQTPRIAASEFLEKIEDDEGTHRIFVREIEEALGSRKLGVDIRTRIENYLRAGAKFVALDFQGIGVVSSSFADEVLGKLAASMGEEEFRRRVHIRHASTTNRGLIENAIKSRLPETRSPEYSDDTP